jgi:hypothetical protein
MLGAEFFSQPADVDLDGVAFDLGAELIKRLLELRLGDE